MSYPLRSQNNPQAPNSTQTHHSAKRAAPQHSIDPHAHPHRDRPPPPHEDLHRNQPHPIRREITTSASHRQPIVEPRHPNVFPPHHQRVYPQEDTSSSDFSQSEDFSDSRRHYDDSSSNSSSDDGYHRPHHHHQHSTRNTQQLSKSRIITTSQYYKRSTAWDDGSDDNGPTRDRGGGRADYGLQPRHSNTAPLQPSFRFQTNPTPPSFRIPRDHPTEHPQHYSPDRSARQRDHRDQNRDRDSHDHDNDLRGRREPDTKWDGRDSSRDQYHHSGRDVRDSRYKPDSRDVRGFHDHDCDSSDNRDFYNRRDSRDYDDHRDHNRDHRDRRDRGNCENHRSHSNYHDHDAHRDYDRSHNRNNDYFEREKTRKYDDSHDRRKSEGEDRQGDRDSKHSSSHDHDAGKTAEKGKPGSKPAKKDDLLELPHHLDVDQFQDLQRLMIELFPQDLLQLTTVPHNDIILTSICHKFPFILIKPLNSNAEVISLVEDNKHAASEQIPRIHDDTKQTPCETGQDQVKEVGGVKKIKFGEVKEQFLPNVTLITQQVVKFYQYQAQMFQYQQQQYDQFVQQRKINESEQLKKLKEMQLLKKQKIATQTNTTSLPVNIQNQGEIDELKAIIESQQSIMGKSGVKLHDSQLSTSHFISAGTLTPSVDDLAPQPLDGPNVVDQTQYNSTAATTSTSTTAPPPPTKIPPFMQLKKKSGTGLPASLKPTTITSSNSTNSEQNHSESTPINTDTYETPLSSLPPNPTHQLLLEEYKLRSQRYIAPTSHQLFSESNQLLTQIYPTYQSLLDNGHPDLSNVQFAQESLAVLNNVYHIAPNQRQQFISANQPSFVQPIIESTVLEQLTATHPSNTPHRSQQPQSSNKQSTDGPVNVAINFLPSWVDEHFLLCFCGQFGDIHGVKIVYPQTGPHSFKFHRTDNIYAPLISTPTTAQSQNHEHSNWHEFVSPDYLRGLPFWQDESHDDTHQTAVHDNINSDMYNNRVKFQPPLHGVPTQHTNQATAFVAFGNFAEAQVAFHALCKIKMERCGGPATLHVNWASPYGAPSKLICKAHIKEAMSKGMLLDAYRMHFCNFPPHWQSGSFTLPNNSNNSNNSNDHGPSCCDFMANSNGHQKPATHVYTSFDNDDKKPKFQHSLNQPQTTQAIGETQRTTQMMGEDQRTMQFDTDYPSHHQTSGFNANAEQNKYLWVDENAPGLSKETTGNSSHHPTHPYLFTSSKQPIRETLKGVHVALRPISDHSKVRQALLYAEPIPNPHDPPEVAYFRETLGFIPIIPAGSNYIQVKWPKGLLEMRLIDTTAKTISTKLHYNFELQLSKHFYHEYLREQNISQQQHIEMSGVQPQVQNSSNFSNSSSTLLFDSTSPIWLKYGFIFDIRHENRVYYQWRLYSYLQGDDIDNYSLLPFQIYHTGPYYIPPTPSATPLV